MTAKAALRRVRATVLPGLIDRHVHLFNEEQPNDARAALSGLNLAHARILKKP